MTGEASLLGLSLVGASCWWLGGRGVSPLRKSWRRHLWPLAVGLVAWSRGVAGPLVLLGTVAMMTAHSLGYGEDDPLWKRTVTGSCLGGCLLPFGVAWWQALLVAGWFLLNYALSLFWNRHTHAFTETTTGAIQGGVLGMGIG